MDLDAVETNIVIFQLAGKRDAAAFVLRLKERGVLTSAIGQHAVRLVTHHDLDRGACERAAKAICAELDAIAA